MAKRTNTAPVVVDAPCIYADDVTNIASQPGVLKFYLTRDDPPPAGYSGDAGSVPRVVAQIVMPKMKVVEMLIFFADSLRKFEEKGSLY